MMNKKAQGALEFLTTYGWAFLVILIMIGALGYFGILNPTRFLPERCNVNSEFSCEEFSLEREDSGDLTFTVVLRNTLGQAIDLDVAANNIILLSDVMTEEGFNNTAAVAIRQTEISSLAAAGTPNSCQVAGGTSLASDKLTIAADQQFAVQCTVDADSTPSALEVTLPGEGNKLKVSFNLNYVPQGKSLNKAISGEVFAALQ